jgi:hypothetical protein
MGSSPIGFQIVEPGDHIVRCSTALLNVLVKERNMQRKLVGAVGVMSAFAALDSAQAAAPSPPDVAEFLKPQSFAELLAPIHNAAALLKALDEAQSAERKANPQVAQYYYHHHHHHHHSYWRSGPPSYDDGRGFYQPEYGYNYGGGSSAHDRRMQIIWCTQHPGRC